MHKTITECIRTAEATALAIGAPDRSWLTYAGLRDQTAKARAALRANGISAQDRVAIVLPNGPDM
ncbi:MAG: AMP-binding protein, partial [Pseudomonadota bacterium]